MGRSFAAAALLFCLTACGAHPVANEEAIPAPANAVVNLAQAPQPIAAPRDPSLLARCHTGVCVWFRIVGRQLVRGASGERLLRVAIIFGGPTDANDDSPDPPRDDRMRWGESPEEIWFLCSASRPTVILQGDAGGWEATTLDFVGGPYGVTEAVSAQYVGACHPGDDMNRAGFAARHNYRAMMPQVDTYSLANPEAIFDHHN